MVVSVVRHYILVGLVFAFAGGWILTLILNGLLGIALEESGVLQGDPYWWALLSTSTSLTIVALLCVFGNKLHRRMCGPDSMSQWALLISTVLFMATVSPIIGPQLSFAVGKIQGDILYTKYHPGDAAKLLSLPVLKWSVLPICYVLAGRINVKQVREAGAETLEH